MRRVWPGLVVEDNTVQVHISAIRKALGADRDMLKTISGRGYRLLGDWTNPAGEHRRAVRTVPERARSSAHPFLTNVPVAASALVGRESRSPASLRPGLSLSGSDPDRAGRHRQDCAGVRSGRRLFPTLEGDVLFVELVSLSDPELVPSTIAHVLNLQLHGDEMSPELVAARDRQQEGACWSSTIASTSSTPRRRWRKSSCACARTCRVLATSRELLRIEGEFAYRVPALEVPAQASGGPATMPWSTAPCSCSSHGRVRCGRIFEPQGEKLPAIAAICRQLDGIPLAIEFAAARAATLGIQQVAGRLDDRFALLTGGRRTALPRHQTLRATLDWSYELLPEAERRLLRHLSIFPAGFTLEAATAVVGDAESSVALGISSLVSKSLVTMDGSEAAPRWRLLETVRVYSLEKLVDSGEHGQAMRRLADSALLCSLRSQSRASLQAAIDDLGHYRREIDNLRAALNWAFSSGGDAALGVELAATASDFWIAVSLVAECCEWAEKALGRSGCRRNAQRDDSAMQSRLRPDLHARDEPARPRGAVCGRSRLRGVSRISTTSSAQPAGCGCFPLARWR